MDTEQLQPIAGPGILINRLAVEARSGSESTILAAARELLGMELAYSTLMTPTEQIWTGVDGDAEAFDLHAGTRLRRSETLCDRILAGRLPALMSDLGEYPEAASLSVVEASGARAFASVPIRRPSGALLGTLCCASRSSRPDLGDRDVQYLHVLARLIADQREREGLMAEQHRLVAAVAGVRALIAAVEARDSYTGMHSQLVVDLATAVARRLGLQAQEIAEVEQVALLHDLGKIRTPDAILHKPGPLEATEWEAMRLHPEHGAGIVASVPELEHLARAIRCEHERWDGRGYPHGLRGIRIPIASRITLVCDAYHAMTSDRPYRLALDEPTARAEIAAGAGTQFCPRSAVALLAVLSEEDAASAERRAEAQAAGDPRAGHRAGAAF